MIVATLRLELLINHCSTMREKRQRIRQISDKLHRHFNVAVAEADRDGDPAHALYVVATVARTRSEARHVLEQVADALAAHPRITLVSSAIAEF